MARIQHNLTTTAFEIDGYWVVKNLGIVRGIIVRSRSVIGTMVPACKRWWEATSRSSPSFARRPAMRPLN